MKKLILLFILFIHLNSFVQAKVLGRPDQELEHFYSRCVSRFMHSSMMESFHQANNPIWPQVNSYCRCQAEIDLSQLEEFKKKNMAYFFQDRNEYFMNLDICLQENVEHKYYKTLSRTLSASLILKALENKLAEQFNASHYRVPTRSPASFKKSCMKHKLIAKCSTEYGIFFFNKCIEKSLSDSSLIDQAYKECFEDRMMDSSQWL